MAVVAFFFFASFAYSVFMIYKNGYAGEKRLFLFPLVDLAFSLALLALILFKLNRTWVEFVLFAVCCVYMLYRAKYNRQMLTAEKEKREKKDREE